MVSEPKTLKCKGCRRRVTNTPYDMTLHVIQYHPEMVLQKLLVHRTDSLFRLGAQFGVLLKGRKTSGTNI